MRELADGWYVWMMDFVWNCTTPSLGARRFIFHFSTRATQLHCIFLSFPFGRFVFVFQEIKCRSNEECDAIISTLLAFISHSEWEREKERCNCWNINELIRCAFASPRGSFNDCIANTLEHQQCICVRWEMRHKNMISTLICAWEESTNAHTHT